MKIENLKDLFVPHILQIGGAWSCLIRYSGNKVSVPHILQIGGAWSRKMTNPLFSSTQS